MSTYGVVKAERNETDKQVVVGSVQTVSRENRLEQLPTDFDFIVSDEAHHARAATYCRIYEYLGLMDEERIKKGEDPGILKECVELIDSHEKIRSRFPPPEKSYTFAEVESGIKEGNHEAISALYHFVYSEPMREAMLTTFLREPFHQVIATEAPTRIDSLFFKMVDGNLTQKELKKLLNELDQKVKLKFFDSETRQGGYDFLLCQEERKWEEEKPYAELLEKVLNGFFGATLPEFAKNDVLDEVKSENRQKRRPPGGFEYLDRVVDGEVTRREKLERTKTALQTKPNIEFINREALLALCDEDERQVIEFIEEGYTQEEIAKKLGRTQPWVSKKIKKIKNFLCGME